MIERFLNYLAVEKRASSHTILAYKTDLEQFSVFLTSFSFETKLVQVSYPIVRSWLLSLMDENIQARSINRKIATLKSFYKFLLREELISVNPMSKVRPLKVKKSLPNFVPEENMLRMLDHEDAFSADFEGRRDRMIFELLYGTGIRLSELIQLASEEIDLYNSRIKVKGKGSKERLIPFNRTLLNEIKAYMAEKRKKFDNESKYFLVNDKGRQLYPVFVYRKVQKYLALFTTLEKRSPHVLRHTYATHLVNKGAELKAVRDLLGHESLNATQVYSHTTLDRLKEVFDQAHPKA